jgi:hypothetical protein
VLENGLSKLWAAPTAGSIAHLPPCRAAPGTPGSARYP